MDCEGSQQTGDNNHRYHGHNFGTGFHLSGSSRNVHNDPVVPGASSAEEIDKRIQR